MQHQEELYMKQTVRHQTTSPSLVSFIRNLSVEYNSGGEILYDGRNQVKRFVIEEIPVIVKRYKRPNLIQSISYTFFKPNKAERAYDYALRLESLGIDTPRALGCHTVCRWGLVREYYFVSAEDRRPSCAALRDKHLPYRTSLVEALAAFFVRMHGAGFLHGDTNLTNFLYQRNTEDDTFSFSTIDLNRSKFIEHPTRQECLLNFVRLSHDREILSLIVRAYARQRGWDETESYDFVLAHVERFERKKARSYRLKGKPLEEWMKGK